MMNGDNLLTCDGCTKLRPCVRRGFDWLCKRCHCLRVIKEIAVLVLVALVLLGSSIGMYSCGRRYTGTGEKVGTVIKLGRYGFYNKTWEGELIRGGMTDGSGAFSVTPLEFTITDPALVAQVQDALNRQYEVRVRYNTFFFRPYDSGNCNNFLVAIEPLAKVQGREK